MTPTPNPPTSQAEDADRRPRGARRSGWRRLLAIPTPLIFVGSVAIAILLLWRQGSLGNLGTTARQLPPGLLVGVFALYLVGLGLLCLRWYALVRMAGGEGTVPLAAEAFLTSVVINYAAPIGLAVPTRAALSARDLGLPAKGGAAVALWEVLLDVAVLGVLSAVWLAAGGARVVAGIDLSARWLGPAAVALLMTLGLVGLVAVRRPGLRRRVGLAVGEMLRYPGRRPRAALLALTLSVVYWAGQAVVLRLLLGAVDVGRGPEATLVLGLLGPPVLIGMLSPVPGGAGVRELLMVAVAETRGVDVQAVVVAAVVYRLALFVAIPPLYAGARFWRAIAGRRSPVDRR